MTVNGTGAGVQAVINGGAGDDAVTVNGSPNLMTSPLVVIGGSNNLPGNTLAVNGATTWNEFYYHGFHHHWLGLDDPI